MKILVGYDGSEHSRRALEVAAELAKNGDPVTVVAVADVGMMSAKASPDIGKATHRKRVLDEASELLTERGVTAETIPAEGHPGDAIVEEAKNAGADLIVVGTRGLSTTQRIVLGSVSTKVVHDAPCNVLVVR